MGRGRTSYSINEREREQTPGAVGSRWLFRLGREGDFQTITSPMHGGRSGLRRGCCLPSLPLQCAAVRSMMTRPVRGGSQRNTSNVDTTYVVHLCRRPPSDKSSCSFPLWTLRTCPSSFVPSSFRACPLLRAFLSLPPDPCTFPPCTSRPLCSPRLALRAAAASLCWFCWPEPGNSKLQTYELRRHPAGSKLMFNTTPLNGVIACLNVTRIRPSSVRAGAN